MTIRRLDHMGVVVDDLEDAVAFFVDLGMEVEGRASIEGPEVDRLCGLDGVRTRIAMMRTPDGHGRLELTSFLSPAAVRSGPQDEPVNAFGLRSVMFAVDDLDGVLSRLRARGAETVGEVVRYGEDHLLCYVRGPAGIVVALAESLR